MQLNFLVEDHEKAKGFNKIETKCHLHVDAN